jgi:PKD domain
MNNSYLWVSILLPSLVLVGCSDAAGGEGEGTGTLQAALNGTTQSDLRSKHDVAKIRYDVLFKGQACTDKPLAEVTVALEDESLPSSLLPDGGSTQHPFGDALIVLAAGQYTVCATPLTAKGAPSAECPTTSTIAFIAEGVTTEIVMVSQCKGSNNGALDAITVLNTPPVIDNLIITPSKFITLCDSARLTVEATDPDGDALSFLWQLLGSNMRSTNQSINFRSLNLGTFQLKVTVSDPFGASTSLTVPIHVSPCADAGSD